MTTLIADFDLATTTVAERVATPTRPRFRVTEAWVFAAASGAVYLLLAAVFLRYDIRWGDPFSRFANGALMFLAPDKKLSAIGFVWNPLPSILALPFIPLAEIWPALLKDAFGANILSVLGMAYAVATLRRIAAQLRAPAGVSRVVVLLFAFNPMIIVFGANGMTEAIFIAALLQATLHLIRWVDEDSPRALIGTGVWLMVAYLMRFEAVVATVLVLAFVVIRSARGLDGAWRARLRAGLADGLVVGFPAIFAFVWWATTSRIITGDWIAQLQSQYGNDSIVAQMLGGHASTVSKSHLLSSLVKQIALLGPGLAVITPIALAMCLIRPRRLPRFIIPYLTFGGVLAFQWIWQVRGKGGGWERYSIYLIPMLAVSFLMIMAERPSIVPRSWPSARIDRLIPMVILILPLAAADVGSFVSMNDTTITGAVGQVSGEDRANVMWTVDKIFGTHLFNGRIDDNAGVARRVAARLDAENLPRRSVIFDVGAGNQIFLTSRRRDQFLLTTDRHFQPAMENPGTFTSRYIMLTKGSLNDFVTKTWPHLWDVGADWAEFVFEQDGWKLYRITKVATNGEDLPPLKN